MMSVAEAVYEMIYVVVFILILYILLFCFREQSNQVLFSVNLCILTFVLISTIAAAGQISSSLSVDLTWFPDCRARWKKLENN